MHSKTQKILHITKVYKAGVKSSIDAILLATPELDHIIVSPQSHDSLFQLANTLIRGKNFSRNTIYHLHSSHAGILRLILPKSRTVYTPHCYAFDRRDIGNLSRGVYKVIERLLANRSLVWAVSPSELRSAMSLGAKKVIQGLNAVEVESPTPQETDKQGRKRVAFIGRITAAKDPEYAAQVSKNLVEKGVEVIWIGDGDQKYLSSLQAAGVIVTGWLEKQEVYSKLASSDLVAHTALWESNPVALLEAASLGVPIIVRQGANLEELGYFSSGGEPDHFSQLLFNSLDSHTLRKLRTVSTQISTQHSIPNLRPSILFAYADRGFRGQSK